MNRGKSDNKNDQGKPSEKSSNDAGRRCFRCNKTGHIAIDCPNKGKDKSSGEKSTTAGYVCKGKHTNDISRQLSVDEDTTPGLSQFREPGKINGQKVQLLRDTGCTHTMVRASLVPAQAYLDDMDIVIRLVDGSTRQVPTAMVHIESKHVSGDVRVGVLDTLPEDVLLGNDLAASDMAYRCVNRQQYQNRVQEEKRASENEQETGVKANPLLSDDPIVQDRHQSVDSDSKDARDNAQDTITQNEVPSTETEGHDEVRGPALETDPGTHVPCPVHLPDKEVYGIKPEKMKSLQMCDPSLKEIRDKVVSAEKVQQETCCFYWKEGFLFRKWIPKKAGDRDLVDSSVHQLVLPKACHPTVLRVGHDIPQAGHLGVEKTKARILKNYYWPGVFKDIAEYCRTCPECQKSGKRRSKDKAPFISVPTVDVPFRKVAIDIIGPLPRTKRGNHNALVSCDYATRYPEAVAISSMEASKIADELWLMFSHVGIPDELLSDQGSNFTSQLMEEVCKTLGIKKMKTTLYHPMANGLVERFNGTLKAMLRKYVASDPDTWDKYLPYLLFAYREVPQESTGFSPFELLYGRHVRGPLDVLQESWMAKEPEEQNVVQYVMEMRKNLTDITEIAQSNLAKSQTRQKVWYDRKARVREFEAGEKVLVLLPSASNKLQAEWQGP